MNSSKVLSGLSALIMLVSCNQNDNARIREISVIPRPQSVVFGRCDFTMSHATVVRFDRSVPGIRVIADQMKRFIQDETLPGKERGMIELSLDDQTDVKPSGYHLRIQGKKIRITAKEPTGLFYGMQTLMQLIPDDGSGKIPGLDITDSPAFGWRGTPPRFLRLIRNSPARAKKR